MRLIDADALTRQVVKKLHITNSFKDITDLIDEAPTTDVNKLQTSAEQNIDNGEVSVSDMAGDLVSRDEVLALINKAMDNTDNKDIQDYIFCGLRRDVHNLPSAEPSLKAIKKQIDEHWYLDKNDLISRDDAIKTVREFFKSCLIEFEQDYISKEEKNIIKYNKAINNKLRELPSAETVHVETYRGLYEKYVDLKHALAEKPIVKPSVNDCDLVSREEVLETFKKFYSDMGVNMVGVWNKQLVEIIKEKDIDDTRLKLKKLWENLKALPSAVPQDNDWSKYSDRLWKLAYERGKADRPKFKLELITEIVRQLRHLDYYVADTCDRPKGEWKIRDDMPKLDNTYSIECSECGQLMFGHYNADNPNYCPHCGADMRKDADR